MFSTYEQLGYVTSDFDRAIALIREVHELGPFKETRDLTIGARAGRTVTGHFAQAFKGDLQFEVIEPIGGDTGFYVEDLPAAPGVVRLHHVGRYQADPEAYAAAIEGLSERWAMVVDHAGFGGSYCYFRCPAVAGALPRTIDVSALAPLRRHSNLLSYVSRLAR